MSQTKPLHDYVLLRELTADELQKGRIVLPENFQDGAVILKQGEVVDVGPGKRAPKNGALIPMAVEKGDKVFFVPIGASQINGTTIVSEANVVAKF